MAETASAQEQRPPRLSRAAPRTLPAPARARGAVDHIDTLYRAAWALCGSRHDAEDLVQETFVNVLKRPRLLREDNELGYLLRALRNTYATRYRSRAHRPVEHRLFEDDAVGRRVRRGGQYSSREIMEAIASAPPPLSRRGDRGRPAGPLLSRGREVALAPARRRSRPASPRAPACRARAARRDSQLGELEMPAARRRATLR